MARTVSARIPGVSRQMKNNTQAILKTYDDIERLLERGQPFSKHELGDICEAVVEHGFKKSGLRYFIAYRDNQQGSHPDFVVWIWYKHQLLVIAIECHNYHLHYLVPQSWAKRNSIDKFESLTIKADARVVFGSVEYSEPSRKLIVSRGIQIWDTPDVTETRESFKGAVKLFIAFLLKWITDTLNNIDYTVDSTKLSSHPLSRVNNRFSIIPYSSNKVIYEYFSEVKDG